MSDLQKHATPGRPKGCSDYPPEFKQRLIAASFEPSVSVSRLALDNGIYANLLFKGRHKIATRENKTVKGMRKLCAFVNPGDA